MKISNEQLLDMYYHMKLGRAVEHNLELLYRQGQLPGAIYSGIGQEATYVGAASALEDGDALATTHRDMAALLVRGITPKEVMAQHFGKVTSPTKGRGEDNYLGNLSLGIFTSVSMLPDLYPVATGAALYFRHKRKNNVAMAFCGEGASVRGDFHETLNWASVFNLPVVFMVVNNQFAYSTPTIKEMKIANVADRAVCYSMEGRVVDGNNVNEVFQVTKAAVDKARNGNGPTLIEAKTMRMKGHAGHDPADYVPEQLLDEWVRKDPLMRFENYLKEHNNLNEERKSKLEKEIEDLVSEAISFAKESPYPEASTLTTGVYSD